MLSRHWEQRRDLAYFKAYYFSGEEFFLFFDPRVTLFDVTDSFLPHSRKNFSTKYFLSGKNV